MLKLSRPIGAMAKNIQTHDEHTKTQIQNYKITKRIQKWLSYLYMYRKCVTEAYQVDINKWCVYETSKCVAHPT